MTSCGRCRESLVLQQHRQHIARERRGITRLDEPHPALDRRHQELAVELLQRLTDLRRLRLLVPGVVSERGTLDEDHQVVVEPLALLRGLLRTVDPSDHSRQVHHELVSEVDELGLTRLRVGRERPLDDRREPVLLEIDEHVATEQPVLPDVAAACARHHAGSRGRRPSRPRPRRTGPAGGRAAGTRRAPHPTP
jgi:hypothetical protein